VTRPGDILERADATGRLVMIVSNWAHIQAETGRVLACPFIAGDLRDDSAFIVQIPVPEGIVLPELVHWLPTSALGKYLGTAEAAKVAETARLVNALITP
jgi:mRNA-degrading endonuclease toxin of MazEF toxin-antitoxin module